MRGRRILYLNFPPSPNPTPRGERMGNHPASDPHRYPYTGQLIKAGSS